MQGGLFVALTVLAALGTGLMAGVFFAFSTFVMAALGRLSPPQAIAAMQAINVAVITPAFLGPFLGTVALSAVLAGLAVVGMAGSAAVHIVAGAVLYIVGTFGVTIVFNVPRNDALAAVDPAGGEAAATWARYLREWTAWNHVRTAAALAASAAFVLALARG